jgi:aminopeptidase N
MKPAAYRDDQRVTSHPIAMPVPDTDAAQTNFDAIVYEKGASVLRQLMATVTEEAFFEGVRVYLDAHAFGNTAFADLLAELETASGRDLSDWSGLWLETAGVNTLRPAIETDDDGVITTFAVLQSATDEHPTIRPHRLAIGFYNLTEGKLVRDHRVELDVDGERTEVAELVGLRRPDLVLLNDDDLAYAKIRLDEASHGVALANLSEIESPLARALVWSSVWDATRDGETRASDYLALVLGNIASETESTTLRIVLANAVLAASAYVAPERRAEARRSLADGFWRLAQEAEGGSDAQFQFVMNFAAIAEAGSHVDQLAALYDGSLELDGLEIDTDLGWELLIALVAAGRAGDAEIDERLAGDNTATGQQSAAHARAAIQTIEGKERAWASLIDVDTATNTVVRETAEGFLRANDPALLEAFVDRYFGMLERIWDERSYAIAEKLVDGLYPSPLANRALADASRTWLDAHPDVPALRRLVIERLAGVDRALVAQERDAQDA